MIFKMAFAMILRETSPTPIGLTPGHLSSGIRRHTTKALSPSGLTPVVAMRRPTLASAVHRLLEADLKEEQSLLHAYASSPEVPAVPWVCRAACHMASASRPSNMMGLAGSGSPSTREQASGSLQGGVFHSGRLWSFVVWIHHLVLFQEPGLLI